MNTYHLFVGGRLVAVIYADRVGPTTNADPSNPYSKLLGNRFYTDGNGLAIAAVWSDALSWRTA